MSQYKKLKLKRQFIRKCISHPFKTRSPMGIILKQSRWAPLCAVLLLGQSNHCGGPTDLPKKDINDQNRRESPI